MTTEFALELARGSQLATYYPQDPNRTCNRCLMVVIILLIPSQLNRKMYWAIDVKFARTACLLTEPLAVYFDKDGTGHNAVGRIERKHQCNPKLIASNKEALYKEGSFNAMVDESPTNMFKVVKWWSRNQRNCCLIATKIPHSN
jgi:hypothetical protein